MLNKPRVIPYDFKVAEIDGNVWLYDDSERTYICSATPMIYAEHLYSTADEWGDDPYYLDPTYWHESNLADSVNVPVDCPSDMDEAEAWDDAREEAQSNWLI